MRLPHASSVVVALTTFVAVATVAAVVSQLAPNDRAGAVLPVAPITGSPSETGSPLEAGDELGTLAPESGDSTGADDALDGSVVEPDSSGGTGTGTTVVTPAPAEPVTEPDPQPKPSTPPAAPPGNSGNAPGRGGSIPANENGNGNGKP